MKKKALNVIVFDAYLFGRDVHTMRIVQSLTVRDLANRLHGMISASTLNRLEQGKMPDVTTFVTLLAYMGYEYSRYVRYEESGTPLSKEAK